MYLYFVHNIMQIAYILTPYQCQNNEILPSAIYTEKKDKSLFGRFHIENDKFNAFFIFHISVKY